MENEFQGMMSYAPVLPEVILTLGALALLMYGVFRSGNITRTAEWLALIILALAGWAIVAQDPGEQLLFNGSFVQDDFARFMKLLVLAATGFTILIGSEYLRDAKMDRYEYPGPYFICGSWHDADDFGWWLNRALSWA